MRKNGLRAGVEYRLVDGYSGYIVGDDGSVLSCRVSGSKRIGEWTPMKGKVNRYGYLVVGLIAPSGKQKTIPIHTLVLVAFRGARRHGRQCRHLDGDKRNNRLANLTWGTIYENAQDRVKHGTCSLLRTGTNHPQGRLTDEQIAKAITLSASGMRQQEIAKVIGCSRGYVSTLVTNGGRSPRRKPKGAA